MFSFLNFTDFQICFCNLFNNIFIDCDIQNGSKITQHIVFVFKAGFCNFSQLATHTEYVKIKQKRWRVLQKSCLHKFQVKLYKNTKSLQSHAKQSLKD